MAAEIVHDDVALFEHRYELLFDIGSEAMAVDRPVEGAGRQGSGFAEVKNFTFGDVWALPKRQMASIIGSVPAYVDRHLVRLQN